MLLSSSHKQIVYFQSSVVAISLALYLIFAWFVYDVRAIAILTIGLLLIHQLITVYTCKGVSSLNTTSMVLIAYVYFFINEAFNYDMIWTRSSLKSFTLISIAIILLSSVCVVNRLIRCNEGTYIGDGKKYNIFRLNKRAKVLLLTINCIFLLVMLPAVSLIFLDGRAAAYQAYYFGPLYIFIISLGIILPFFNFKLLCRSSKVPSKIVGVVLIGLILLTLGLTGTRFYALYALGLLSSLLIDFKRVSTLTLLVLSSFGILIGNLIKVIRTTGHETTNLTAKLTTLPKEGLLEYFSKLIEHYDIMVHSYIPVQSLYWLYFWVPRSLWQGKPELIGSWLLDSKVVNEVFGSGHSVSVSFVGPFFSDFGDFWFIPFLVFSIVVAKLEVLYIRYIGEFSFFGIIAGLFPVIIFFMVRSYNTSLISLITCVSMAAILFGLLGIKHKK